MWRGHDERGRLEEGHVCRGACVKERKSSYDRRRDAGKRSRLAAVRWGFSMLESEDDDDQDDTPQGRGRRRLVRAAMYVQRGAAPTPLKRVWGGVDGSRGTHPL